MGFMNAAFGSRFALFTPPAREVEALRAGDFRVVVFFALARFAVVFFAPDFLVAMLTPRWQHGELRPCTHGSVGRKSNR
jgi:hypothetical protein